MDNQKDTHFAIYKPTNEIVYSWDYNGYDPAELRQFRKNYFIVDLIDNDIDYKQCKILTYKSLMRMGIDPDDTNNWKQFSYMRSDESIDRAISEAISRICNRKIAERNSICEDMFNALIQKRCNINETSVNRMIKWLSETDCAFITAFRNTFKDIQNPDRTYYGPDGHKWQEGYNFTHEDNRQRNKRMIAELLAKGYGVIKVKGVYPEGMTNESSEESYLVFNRSNDGNFFNTLFDISEEYNQDSFYYKPQGGMSGYLVGTNACDFPGYKQKGTESKFMENTASNYMSRLGNKAFAFVSDDAVKNVNRAEAMNQIEDEVSRDEYNQHYWQDKKPTSFRDRKKMRSTNEGVIRALVECCDINGVRSLDTMHPLSRKSMFEWLKKH